MKNIIFTLILTFTSCAVFGWGSGHKVQMKLVQEKLPPEIISLFNAEQKQKMLVWCFYPDGHKKHSEDKAVFAALGAAQAAALDKILTSQYNYHKTQGKCIAFTMLAKSLREKNYDAAAFFSGCLMHGVADAAAFNHGPLIHMLTYFNFNKNAFPKVNLDLGVYLYSPEIQSRTAELLKDFKPDLSEKNLDDMLVKLDLLAFEDCAFMAGHENKLVRKCADETSLPKSYVETMAQTANRQAREGADLICAAWRIANSNQPIEPESIEYFHSSKEKIDRPLAKKSSALIADFLNSKKLENDGIYEGLFAAKKKYPAIGIIAETSSEMNQARLSFNSRMFSAITARTLKNSGENIEMIKYDELDKMDLNPKKFPILVLCTRSFFPSSKTLQKYIDADGKILLIGGVNMNFLNLGKYAKNRPNAETPATTSYGVANANEIKNMKIAFTSNFAKSSKKNPVSFERNPNTSAGWGKPLCNIEIKTDSPNVVPLAHLQYGVNAEKYCVSAAFKNDKGKIFAIWLPQYLVIPMLLSDDDEKMPDWSLPVLDSFGKPLVLESIKMLSEK